MSLLNCANVLSRAGEGEKREREENTEKKTEIEERRTAGNKVMK